MSKIDDSANDPTTGSTNNTGRAPDTAEVSKWQRVLLILLFALIYQVSELVFAAVSIFQIFCRLLTDSRNERLNDFSTRLTHYMYGVLQYVCQNSESTPWPLDEPEDKIEIVQG